MYYIIAYYFESGSGRTDLHGAHYVNSTHITLEGINDLKLYPRPVEIPVSILVVGEKEGVRSQEMEKKEGAGEG